MGYRAADCKMRSRQRWDRKYRENDASEFFDCTGVIYAHQREVSIGRCTLDLHLIAEASEPEELRDRVIFLPL